jgi:hypothetical protein
MMSLEDDAKLDLWWQAREHSRKVNRLYRTFNPVVVKVMSFAGKPVRPVLSALALGRDRSKVTLAIDLNKYREPQVARVEEYRDAGVDLFIGRMGGPTRWVDGQWNYAEDKTWRMMLENLAKIGIEPVQTVGYGVQNPFIGGESNYTDDHFSTYLNQWGQGGADPGAYMCDTEVNTCWRNGVEITQTPVNMIRSLANDTEKVWQRFKKICGIYSGKWFFNKVGLDHYVTYFDNINRGEMRRPVWLAWLPQTINREFTNLEEILDILIVPTESQKNAYLRIGSTEALLWQFLFNLRLPGDSVGVDASVSLLPKEDVLKALNMGTQPEPPKPPEPEPEPDNALTARVEVLEALAGQHGAQLEKIKAGLKAATE